MSFWSNEIIEAAENQGGGSYESLPAGQYLVLLSDAELKDTKSGDGSYLKLVFEVTSERHAGRKIFDNVTVRNKNAQAVGIGLGHLRELSTACGVDNWFDKIKAVSSWEEAEEVFQMIYDDLGNIEVIASVGIRKSEQYGDQNEIKRFKKAPEKTSPVAKAAFKEPWD